MLKRLRLSLSLFVLLFATSALAQGNGMLQIHYMDVGQGDGAVLISPAGQVVLFDDGDRKSCDKPVSYLQQLGISKIDYHITSHYHDDHIGCASQVFREIAMPAKVFDRGSSYPTSGYQSYAALVANQRETATAGMKVVLDSSSISPVEIEFVALNGNGVSTTNENDLSLVSVVRFGEFKTEFGGDLSGYKTGDYEDIETSVAPKVGQIQVYKVHHHCSRYSTNNAWLAETKPLVGIISVGDGNRYNHPTEECLERLHLAGVKTYWTETGNGADADPGYDTVGGNIIVEVAPNAHTFTVSYKGRETASYQFGAVSTEAVSPTSSTKPSSPEFAWSKKSSVYHYINCKYVDNISPGNLEKSASPPEGKTLHKDCPK